VSPVAVILVLIAACAHATWNLVAKKIGSGGALFVWLYQTLSVAIYLPGTVVVLAVSQAAPDPSWLLPVVISAVLHNTYAIVLQHSYAVGDLSVVYPVARGSGPVLSVLAAVLLLGERPAPFGLAGAAAVVLGILLIGSGSLGRTTGGSVRSGLLTGVTIAGFTLWDAYSVRSIALPPLGYFCARAVLQSAMLTPYALRRREPVRQVWREHRAKIVIVAVLAPVASVLVLYALRLAPVSMIAPARELSIVLGSVFAWHWLGEPNPVRRLTGSVVVLAGILAIALAG
jgi:drug/metabolite transporter (DMT)-like permease